MKSLISILFVFALLFVSCNISNSESAPSISKMDANLESQQSPAATQERADVSTGNAALPTIQSRKLIWTANLTFQVKDVQKSSAHLRSICEKHNGFIADMNMTSTNYRKGNSLTIRVPNDQFQSLLESIKGESIFLDEASVNSNDVTEEYIDIETRLKTKREVRDRYIDILNTKTGSVQDIIDAEEAIRVITEEIEVKEGRLRYLKDQISLSTIFVNMYQKVEYTEEPSRYTKDYSDKMADSFSSGWRFISNLFLTLIQIWPLILLFTFVGIWQRKRIKALIELMKS